MQSFVALAFVGAAVAQQGYPAPQAYGPPPAYGAPSSSSSSSVTIPTQPKSPSTTTSSPPSYPTTTCPAPGSEDSQGRYSCNPAHQYPAGQTCELVDGCYFLSYPPTTTAPAQYPTTTSTKPSTSSTVSCPAPGSTDSKGRYSCNPAHQYPAGQTCKFIDGCPYLEYPPTTTAPAQHPTTSSTKPSTSSTVSCPAPGSTDSKGRYSCNPAHQYPAGQTCKFIDGCPYLEYPKTSSEEHPPTHPTTTEVVKSSTTKSQPSPTASCPAPGSTDSKGRYSCNPAHQYPAGQTCELVDGCYFLEYPKTTAPASPTKPVKTTVYTTDVITSYCPEPTTFTHESSTYTITKATTITLPCKGGCTVTKPVHPVPTSPVYHNTTVPVHKPSTVIVPQPPKTLTTVETVITSYCPEPTTFTHGQSTIVITTATTLTLPCPGGCTVTKEIPQPPKTTVITTTIPQKPVTTLVTKPGTTVPVVETHTVPAPSKPVSPEQPKPSSYAPPAPSVPVSPEQPKPSSYAPPAPSVPIGTAPSYTRPVATATTSMPVQYTGAASKNSVGAALALGAAALFL